jgi:hypothetical protein
MSSEVADLAAVSDGEAIELDIKGKAERVSARVVTVIG